MKIRLKERTGNFIIGFTVLLIFLFSSCTENKVIGKWKFESGGDIIPDIQLLYTFKEDHTGTMSFITQDRIGACKFKWEIERGKIIKISGTYWKAPDYNTYHPFQESFFIQGDKLVQDISIGCSLFLPIYIKSFSLYKYE